MKNPDFIGLSIQGKRTSNQDTFLAVQLSEDVYFFGVADGMGGTAGGKLASTLVIETAGRFLQERVRQRITENDLKDVLQNMFELCQETIAKRLLTSPELEGMGTTLSCLLLYKTFLAYGNIGDSRIYRNGQKQVDQITLDHSLVQDYKSKFGGPLPAHILQQGNVITRAIDGKDDHPDIYPAEGKYLIVKQNDVFLLCSDGLLLSKADDQQNKLFYNYIKGTKSLVEACQQLICLAYNSGSTDNITVVLVAFKDFKRKKIHLKRFKYPPEIQQQSSGIGSLQRKTSKRPNRLILAVAVIATLVTTSLFAYYFISSINENKKDIHENQEATIQNPENQGKTVIPGFSTPKPTTPVNRDFSLEWDLSTNTGLIKEILLAFAVNGNNLPSIHIKPSQSAIKLSELTGIKLPSRCDVIVTLIAIKQDGSKAMVTRNIIKFEME